MQVYAHILTWNDDRYLESLFKSIEAQTFDGFIPRVLDNGSSDGTIEWLQEHYPRVLVGRNLRNNGFAGGHDQLLKYTIDHLAPDVDPNEIFILVGNSDMIWDKDVMDRLVKALKADSVLAAVQPKIYRAFGDRVGEELLDERIQSDIIDTTGLSVQKGWRMSDRGAGQMDKGQYDMKTDIFGVTGTMSLFRLSALLDVAIKGEFFDEDFFAYREDCDLAWRLRHKGWKSQFVPEAIAYHYRGMYGAEKQSWWERVKNRRGQRPFFAALSTRNQLFLLVKNLSVKEFLYASPWILFNETVRVLYGFIFERETRKRLLTMWKLLYRMIGKRRIILESASEDPVKIRSYVGKM